MAAFKLRVIRTNIDGQPASKVVALPTVEGETDEQRMRRLKAQAAANRIRVTDNRDGTYTVTSQRRLTGVAGTRGETHDIKPINGQWVCSCRWGEIHPGSACAAIAQLRAYRVRKHLSLDPELTAEEAQRREKDALSEQLEAARRQRSAAERRLHPRVEEIL